MKIEFVNAFVAAAYVVLESLGENDIQKGKLSMQDSPIKGKDISTILGVTGDVQGQVIYGMDLDTAKNLAATMMGAPVAEFNEISKSAVSEFGNMITGNAASELGNNGSKCNITPPTLVMGNDVVVSVKSNQFLVVPLSTKFGTIIVNIALTEA